MKRRQLIEQINKLAEEAVQSDDKTVSLAGGVLYSMSSSLNVGTAHFQNYVDAVKSVLQKQSEIRARINREILAKITKK